MNAEFQWWLLILGIVIGGGLVYLVMADLRTDEDESTAFTITDPDTGEAGDPSAPQRATGDGDDPDRSQGAGPDLGTSDQPGPTIPT